MSSSGRADTWILLEKSKVLPPLSPLLLHPDFGGKSIMEEWFLQASEVWWLGIWLCCAYDKKNWDNYTEKEWKEGSGDVRVAFRFPSSLGSTMPRAGTGSRSLPTFSLVKRFQFTEGIEVARGWWHLSGRERCTLIPCTEQEERETCPCHLPPLLCLTGSTRETREQGGTLLPFPPSANPAQSPSESCFHFQFTAAQFQKNRPRKKLPQSKMFHVGLDTERGSDHNKSLQFAKLERAHSASKSADKPRQDRWLHRSAAVPSNKRHTSILEAFSFWADFCFLMLGLVGVVFSSFSWLPRAADSSQGKQKFSCHWKVSFRGDMKHWQSGQRTMTVFVFISK